MSIKRNAREILKINIKYYRIKANKELAEKTNLTSKYISDLERGIFNVGLEKLEQKKRCTFFKFCIKITLS